MFNQSTRDVPTAESGVGAHLAKTWETSIRQALMPVLSNTSMSCLLYVFEQILTEKLLPIHKRFSL